MAELARGSLGNSHLTIFDLDQEAMSRNLPEGRPIRDFTFEQFRALENVRGYVYPKRNVSTYIPLLSKPERAALNLWGWISWACGLAGLILPFVLGHWAWVF